MKKHVKSIIKSVFLSILLLLSASGLVGADTAGVSEAKQLLSNMSAEVENYRAQLQNATSADEAANIIRQFAAAMQNYANQANNLQSQYNWTDSKVQTYLQSDLESFKQTTKNFAEVMKQKAMEFPNSSYQTAIQDVSIKQVTKKEHEH